MTSNDNSRIEDWLSKQQPIEKSLDLTIIIPAYNEQWRLPGTLIDILDFFDDEACRYEIIVVDDGSNDATAEVVRKFEKLRPSVKLIRLGKNFGKGYAVTVGALNAAGRRVLFADADGATPIGEIRRLQKAIDEGADVAIGSRALESEDTTVKTNLHRKFLGRIFNFVVNTFLLKDFKDTQCGFKLFTRNAARFIFEHQKSTGFSFDLEILLIARRAGMTVREVAVNWENVPGSKVNVIIDGLKMCRDIFMLRWRHRNITPRMFMTTRTGE